MKNSNMNEALDLMWTMEEEISVTSATGPPTQDDPIGGGGGSGGGITTACCCSVPSVLTKWVCPN
ncbi:Uncharacterised protein [Clostridium putrefaciens]|uniref:Uncharacterized protein n=1 Tax=Clostridium putrefaciens TaxID=99675 RepID=A0A381J685_9CLOT|nr:hypothetical protein [Clostridium putrefaciens]SUY46503.1 Uncharacterised protein [Clostridium putrefaciens]